jgi:hypothetical protein
VSCNGGHFEQVVLKPGCRVGREQLAQLSGGFVLRV